MAERSITRAASFFSSATALSRILGFLRDMIIANFLGATGASDSFFVAYRIPNLLRELFAEGSISSAFVPVLSEVKIRYGDEEVKRVAYRTFSVLVVVVGLICIAGEMFTPLIVSTIAPGFTGERFHTTVLLTRIMLPFLLFVSLAAFTMGALHVRRVFFVPALAPAWFNVTVICTILVLYLYFGVSPLIAASVGVSLGGLMQFLTQVPVYLKQGYSYRFDFTISDPWLRKMFKLLVPVVLGLAVTQLNLFVSTLLASYLPPGSVTYLYYAMRLIQLPVGVFGVAMAMAVLPAISEHVARGNKEAIVRDFSYALRALMAITLPATAGLIILRYPIIGLLFQRGEFDWIATEGTAFALVFYSLGICAIVGIKVVVSTFYAMQDTGTPVRIATIALVVNIVASLVLMGPLKHGGLALANALSAWINFLLLLYLLRKRLEGIDGSRIGKTILKVLIATCVMGGFCFVVAEMQLWMKPGYYLQKALWLFISIAGAVTIFLLMSVLLKVEEVKGFLRLWRK